MTHTTQSIVNTFHDAGMDVPDDYAAFQMADNMTCSGYPADHFKRVLASVKPTKTTDNTMAFNLGGQ